MTKDLTIKKLQRICWNRNEEWGKSKDFSAYEYSAGICSEAGELSNKEKKVRLGQNTSRDDIEEEIADVLISLCLYAEKVGIDIEKVTVDKFNKISKKRDSKYYL